MDFLPMPHHIAQGEGVFRLRFDTKIVLDQTKPGALLYARMLRDDLRGATGLDLAILRGKARQGDIALSENAALAPHSYHLAVTPYGARVEGADDEALLNGVMTLRQWGLRNGAALPSVDIRDAPDLAHRGYYMDCSRGRVPTLDTLKQMADQLCRYKINQWQLYIEHTYLFRDLSEAWRDETPLTAEEIMELDAYCAARHIELVPSLASFGHMYQILSTKTCHELCELRDSEKIPFSYTYSGAHHTLNVSNPEAIGFIKGLIEEYGALFTSKRFNICCDETFDLGKDRSKQLADAHEYQWSLTLENRSDAPVATPVAELTLTDAQDKPLLRRVVDLKPLGAPEQLQPRQEWSVNVPVQVQDLSAPVAGYRALSSTLNSS